jgi:ElaB/YqjD/DUF883 family membrane-anchored ribosome-binding protein
MIESYDSPAATGYTPATTNGSNGSKPTPPSFKPVADAIAQEASHLNATTQHWLSEQMDRCKVGARHMQDEAQAFGRKTHAYMRAEPVKSAVIAAIAGMVVAKLLSPSRSRRRDVD